MILTQLKLSPLALSGFAFKVLLKACSLLSVLYLVNKIKIILNESQLYQSCELIKFITDISDCASFYSYSIAWEV